jgi:hypothetical protein|eukprot:COSAG01_NODE_6155_length_3820_cov_23.261758_1_plen_211_part_00
MEENERLRTEHATMQRHVRELEVRLLEQQARHDAELRGRDARIYALTLQLQGVREAEAETTVYLTGVGPIGLTVDELDDGGAWIVAVDPEGQAARHPQLRVGMRVTGVGGRACTALPYSRVVRLIREHTARPLALHLVGGAPQGNAASPPPNDAAAGEVAVPQPLPLPLPPGGAAATEMAAPDLRQPEERHVGGGGSLAEGIPPPGRRRS